MDLSKLKAINDAKAEQATSSQRHNEVLNSAIHTQNTVLSAVESLIRYIEGHTTKTQVVNQLTHIGTPDALKVVQSVNQLHETLKTHKNTDLTEVTKVMSSILDEAKKIPKELPKLEQQEQQDYTKQFSNLVEAVKAVEKVVKEQDLVVHPPVVNVPETNVHVDPPDLKPLQSSIKDVVTAIKKIVIPEYKTDNKAVEKLLKDSNKLLKDILDKPVSSGGGGGGRATPYQDSNGIPAFVTINGGAIPTISPNLNTIVDTSTSPVIYVGKAPIGSTTSGEVWQIAKLDTSSGLIKTWAGNAGFTQIWDNRVGLTYN